MNEAKEKLSMLGVYVITEARLETPEQFLLNDKITELQNKNSSDTRIVSMVRELNTICHTTKRVVKNIIPTVGRQMIANNIGNSSPTNIMYAKYIELGTSSVVPADSDVALGTPVYRNAVASRTNALNIAYVTAFFNATEVSGTFLEAGIFSDGTSTIGSGVLLSHVAIDITKTTSNTLTIDWTLTIN